MISQALSFIFGLQIALAPTEQIFDTKPAYPDPISQEILIRSLWHDVDPHDATILVSIARCESGLDPGAVNVNRNGTRDLGLFQINDVHRIDAECLFDIGCNTNAAIRLYKKQRFVPWKFSSHCWHK